MTKTSRGNEILTVRERLDRIRSLELSRARTLQQIENSTSEKYLALLDRTLKALDEEIQELEISDASAGVRKR